MREPGYTSGMIEESGITIAPGWSAYESYDHVELSAPGIAPSPYHPDRDELFPSGLSFELKAPFTSDHIAEQLVAALAAGALHEGLEWILVEGRRLAEPHPPEENLLGEDNLWDWLVGEIVTLVREYRKRYPMKVDQ